MAKRKKKVEEEVLIEENAPRYLTESEMCKILETNMKLKIIELEILANKKDIDIVEYKRKLLEVDKEKLNLRLNALNQETVKEKESYNQFVKGIKEKYKLSGNWGYNPETGEIV